MRFDHHCSFLRRLARDVRGNTLAIMAAALIPLIGMIGGGVDMSRMYIIKTRLQHACDAGALAGRKSMGGGAWASDDNTVAQQFFDGNIASNAYGMTGMTRSFAEASGKVTGTASATVPMTLMKVLNVPNQTLSVTCSAEMKLPNTDVMFVLDTTGSMNCVAGDTSCTNNGGVPATGSKIDGLKTAVKCFYEIVAQQPTNATCVGNKPSGGTGSQVQVRFGFVPYSSNVNVGRLLPSTYFANNWTYQSRVRNGSASAWSDWQTVYFNSSRNGSCPSSFTQSNPSREYQNGTKVVSSGSYYCQYDYRYYGPQWNYAPTSINLSSLKNGSGWNSSFTLPIEDDGSNRTISWDGCIEERPTVRTTNYSPIPANAYDLNIDLVPSQSNSNSLWGPALDQVIFLRDIVTSYSQADRTNTTTATNYYQPNGACPTEAKKLQTWPTAAAFQTYVDSFVASGNTYHDIGMLWGARLMSPTGLFASSNATTPTGGAIQRHMIFMTDGDSTSSPCDYNAYGVPWWDQRQTTSVGAAADCGSNKQELIDQINYRLAALCTAVKNKGITLWVVSYGGGVNSTTESRLQTCASPPDSIASTHYFSASDPSNLQQTFTLIAAQISQLRLTQ